MKITARCKIGRVLEKRKPELLQKARPWSAVLAQTFSVLFEGFVGHFFGIRGAKFLSRPRAHSFPFVLFGPLVLAFSLCLHVLLL